MSKKMHRLPFKHIVVEENKEVMIVCKSAITAMGISAMVNKYYPGYSAKIISENYFQKQTLQ
tara:strand:- start:77 stop:262 length:186 start_codon:yes stop_codon:yes gene_type:complete